ncbi:flagellar motor protein MotB [Clostridium sp. A1-XYC3]|uniref:Flagellar motor protein MotB n=1 Tax=Clostridium tanneri TaxID=3037988 RepID=A0ABU4JTY2_9CLOT|nr:flagellar motor protein MotB [Clostridium sp. A1-XYC3]MDW8801368.1 flagellar motor protein MotB [Clostridium sp. A1-XYC3]
MKRKKEERGPNLERWMLTYLDLITLLAAFFILMFSISNVDKEKYKQLAISLNQSMGSPNSSIIDMGSIPATASENPPNIVENIEPGEKVKLQELKDKIDKYIKENNLSGDIETTIEDRGLVISFKDSVLFDSGTAVIRPEFEKKVIEVGRMLTTLGNNFIRVEGHTDNVPINNYQFASNWQLSVIRASNVTEFLINNCGIKADKIGATGYGENRPKASNDNEVGRSRNRRVDIVIVNTKFNEVENNKNQ